jgi:hypothetical protein
MLCDVNFVKVLLPPLVGGLLALLVMFGLVWSQTQPPESNPASQPVLTYGS